MSRRGRLPNGSEKMPQRDKEIAQSQLSEPAIDATLADSFPASDPPSWTLGVEPQPELCAASNGEQKGEHVTINPKTR